MKIEWKISSGQMIGDKKMKIECDKCHKVMYVPLKGAIWLYWYKLKKEPVLCPACGDALEEEFQKAGDRVIERCKNLIKELD